MPRLREHDRGHTLGDEDFTLVFPPSQHRLTKQAHTAMFVLEHRGEVVNLGTFVLLLLANHDLILSKENLSTCRRARTTHWFSRSASSVVCTPARRVS
jgi:hypothetical protein